MSDINKPAGGRNRKQYRSRNKGQGGQGNRKRPRYRTGGQLPIRNLSYEDVQRYFIACGRCGYFLTGYRILHGVEALKEATAAIEGGWLSLKWNLKTGELVQKSYGIRTDISLYQLEIACPECQRRLFVNQEESPPDFRIKVL